MAELFVNLQNRHEGLLRHLDVANRLHALLTGLLLLEQFTLARDVAAVALRQNVFALRAYCLTGKHATADGRLDRHLEHLLRNDVFQLFAQHASAVVRLVFVHDERQGIDRLAGKQNVEFLQRARLVFSNS